MMRTHAGVTARIALVTLVLILASSTPACAQLSDEQVATNLENLANDLDGRNYIADRANDVKLLREAAEVMRKRLAFNRPQMRAYQEALDRTTARIFVPDATKTALRDQFRQRIQFAGGDTDPQPAATNDQPPVRPRPATPPVERPRRADRPERPERADRPERPERRQPTTRLTDTALYPSPDDRTRRRDGGLLTNRERRGLANADTRGVRVGEPGLRETSDQQRRDFVLRGGGLNYTEFAYKYEHEGKFKWVYQAYTPKKGLWETEANVQNMRLREIRVRDHTTDGRYQQRVTRLDESGQIASVRYRSGETRDRSPFVNGRTEADSFRPVRSSPASDRVLKKPESGVNLADLTPKRGNVAVPPPKQPTASPPKPPTSAPARV